MGIPGGRETSSSAKGCATSRSTTRFNARAKLWMMPQFCQPFQSFRCDVQKPITALQPVAGQQIVNQLPGDFLELRAVQ
jgi:hypothetical protein